MVTDKMLRSRSVKRSKDAIVECQVSMAAPAAPRWVARTAAVVGVIYLLAVWLDAVRVVTLTSVLPHVARPFVQVAELFPTASPFVIDWRARGWSCATHQFAEIDVEPLFPIHRDDKENRFYRAMFFYHRERRVLAALDDYITRAHNRLDARSPIGGVMLLSLRIPIPRPGSAEERYQRQPLDSYPAVVERRVWYVTAPDERQARCVEAP
jgi:hypothetical protein